ncbi:MAG: nucleotidyltransferase domain-containing protein [Sulfolobales archaeon]
MLNEKWARFALERYSLLRRWRDFARAIARACMDLLDRDCLEVHVVGGAAENRLTVLSDIDIVIVTDNPSLKNIDTIIAIKKIAEQHGLPAEAPIDLKILTPEEFQELIRRKIYRETIKIEKM